MKFSLFLTVLGALALAAQTQAQVAPGQRLSVDVDGDGRPEVIEIISDGQQQAGYRGVRVLGQNGKEVWRSRRGGDPRVDMTFGRFEWGETMPRTVGDIDGDGRAELIVSSIRNDGGPTVFRVYKWAGNGGYQLSRSGILALSRGGLPRFLGGPPSGEFVWAGENSQPQTWVTSLEPSQGRWLASITSMAGNGGYGIASALLAPARGGNMRIIQWLRGLDAGSGWEDYAEVPPGRPIPNRPGGAVILPAPLPGQNSFGDPNDPIVTRYRARISNADHFTGDGKRIDALDQILRKDRANLYKGLGDYEDEVDGFFRNGKNLDVLLKRSLEANDRVKEQIRKSTPLIEVTVTKKKIYLRMVAPSGQSVSKPGNQNNNRGSGPKKLNEYRGDRNR